MRQFYNTAESPEMSIFQIMDTVPSSDATVAQPIVSSADSANGQSSCKNTLRLSLANLLPARLDIDLNRNLLV